jgi:hypothetical protein
MLKGRKIDGWFQLEGRVAGERVRLALRTRNKEKAHTTAGEIERALADGPDSKLWPKLRGILPRKSFERLAAFVGYQERSPVPAPSWPELSRLFEADALRRIALGKFRASTWERYQFETREFGTFLTEKGVAVLAEIDRPLVEEYKV